MSSKLRLGSSFEEVTSKLGLDPTNTDDVRIYHLMLVQRTLPLHPRYPAMLMWIASTKQNRVASDLSRTGMLCCHNSSTTRWCNLPTIGRRSISNFSYRRQRRSTCLHALTLVRGTTWHLAQTTRTLLSVGYFGKLCGEGSRVAKTRICLRTF